MEYRYMLPGGGRGVIKIGWWEGGNRDRMVKGG